MSEYERGYREIRETAARLAERACEDCDEATAVHLRGVALDIRCMPIPRIPPAPDDEALVGVLDHVLLGYRLDPACSRAGLCDRIIAALREAGALR